ncbi:hypothetical protein [Blastococcus sp. CT_GayMR20]|uniref:hypothetical protein n=1 Tax=Blastococcus sp. CT_GayMR20 TaxID=2559609 RepID=UPI0014308AED|nr:hypothetical protein [Blastococcus sp. CT_GayMR20]
MSARQHGRHRSPDDVGHAGQHRAAGEGRHRPPQELRPDVVATQEVAVSGLWGATGALAAAALAVIVFTGTQEPGNLLALPPYDYGPAEPSPRDPGVSRSGAGDIAEVGRRFSPDSGGIGDSWGISSWLAAAQQAGGVSAAQAAGGRTAIVGPAVPAGGVAAGPLVAPSWPPAAPGDAGGTASPPSAGSAGSPAAPPASGSAPGAPSSGGDQPPTSGGPDPAPESPAAPGPVLEPVTRAVEPVVEASEPVAGPVVRATEPVVEAADPVPAPVEQAADAVVAPITETAEGVTAPVLGPVTEGLTGALPG